MAVTFGACDKRPQSPAAGDAFVQPSGSTFGVKNVRPGEQFTVMVVALQNQTRDEVVLEDVSMVAGPGFGDVIEVVDVAVADRVESQPGFVPLGRYLIDPPATRHRGKCIVEELEQVEGHAVAPSSSQVDATLVAIRLATLRSGTGIIRGQSITYRRGGEVYEQVYPLHIRVEVDEDAPPSVLARSERRCIGPAVRPLPGIRLRED